MNHSAEQLASIAQEYWPSTLKEYLSPDDHPRRARLDERWGHEPARMKRWYEFSEGLQRDLPNLTVWNITIPMDPCYRCAAYPSKDNRAPDASWVVVGCMSILAPIYTIYVVRFDYDGKKRTGHQLFLDSFPLQQQLIADEISKKIEATFEVHALPRDIADTAVHLYVHLSRPPKTTLFHALFTSEPESIP